MPVYCPVSHFPLVQNSPKSKRKTQNYATRRRRGRIEHGKIDLYVLGFVPHRDEQNVRLIPKDLKREERS
jgi:hypothetical protein